MDTVYADTETTSLVEPWKSGGRRTWEIALIRVSPGKRVLDAAWLQLVDVDLSNADPTSLEIGKFFQRWSADEGVTDTAGALPAGMVGAVKLDRCDSATAAKAVEGLTRGAVIAGSNPMFDLANFAHLLEWEQKPATWYHHPRDIPNVATGWLAAHAAVAGYVDQELLDTFPVGAQDVQAWDQSSYSTGVLSQACGVPVPADRHSAWADAVWMLEWDCRLTGDRLSEA